MGSGANEQRDAAALSLIDIRRIDRAAGKSTKRGDLTEALRRRANGGAPLATVAPEPAPVAVAVTAPPVTAERPFARRSAPLPEPYVAPEPPPAPEATPSLPAVVRDAPRAAPLPYDDLRSADDLIYYWDELRAGRALPLLASLDRTRIAISWPDTVMVNYNTDQAAMPQIARLSRITGAVEFTSTVTEWILSCSRQVARIGKAMETKRVFNGTRGARNYHMLLLPFADSTGASDHVLCHLGCADESRPELSPRRGLSFSQGGLERGR